MRITENVSIIKRKNGTWVVNGMVEDREIDKLEKFYNAVSGLSDEEKEDIFNQYLADGFLPSYFGSTDDKTIVDSAKEVILSAEEKLERGLSQLIDFFSEFEFTPNFRFINTLAYHLDTQKEAKSYIASYFKLTDSPFKNDVNEKMKSKEFNNILKDLAEIKPTHKINNRFKVYYGAPGTGKTTLAMTETEDRCVVCNSAMLPSDLMEDFCFVDGKPSFKPSALWNCMTDGKPIVLDEMNLLPFDSLRFLQGILDGKKEFQYKGFDVKIADGFEVICTMNLAVNGMVYGLPEPLIDRASEMKEFTLNSKMLMGAIV